MSIAIDTSLCESSTGLESKFEQEYYFSIQNIHISTRQQAWAKNDTQTDKELKTIGEKEYGNA
jgi:hypothetical protein